MKRSRLKRDTEKARAFAQRGRAQGVSRDPERGLTADPEKVAAFAQRGREASQRSLAASARAGARARAKTEREQEGPLSPEEWRSAVWASAAGRCTVTRTRAADVDDRRFHAHHAVPKDELRARGLHAHVWDPRNGVWLLADVHMRHEFPGVNAQRVPREVLPASVWQFAEEMDATDGTSWATEMVRRTHPAAGSAAPMTRRQ